MNKRNMLLVLPLMALLAGCQTNKPADSTESGTISSETETTASSSSEVVLNPSVKITAETKEVYITKQITLTANVTDSTDTVVWASSDTTKATVDGGVVTAVAAGEVKITASLSKNAEVKDEVTIKVLDALLDASVNASAWDFSKLYQADAAIEPVAASSGNTNDIKTYAAFKNATGKQYVAKAHFDVKSVGDWVWNTLTIGHINADGQIYGTGFSQNSTKLITQFSKTAGGVEQLWGAMSDRSQIWDQYDLASFDITNGIDVMSVRDNGDFYFFMNGNLYWKEGETFNDYDEIDTTPVIYLNGVDAKVSNLSVSTSAEEVAKVVSTATKKYFPTYAANVEISDDQKIIKFKNTDSITDNNKDVAAKTIGDAALLPANKESKIEFDLAIDTWGSNNATPAVCVDLRRYDSDVAETRSFMVAETGISFAGWNYNGVMPAGLPAGETKYSDGTNNIKMAQGKTYHVACTRLMLDGGQDTKLDVYDGETLVATATHNWQDGYKGNAVPFFSVRNVNATLSNITITVAE